MPILKSELDSVLSDAIQTPSLPPDGGIVTTNYQRGSYRLRTMTDGDTGDLLGANVSNGVRDAGRRTSTMFFKGGQTLFTNYVHYEGRNGDEMHIVGEPLAEKAARALLNLARKQP